MKKIKGLIYHLTLTLPSLHNIHRNAGVVIWSDRNEVAIEEFLAVHPMLHQILKHKIHGVKTLDVLITPMSTVYQEPISLPPLTPDSPSIGVASDTEL